MTKQEKTCTGAFHPDSFSPSLSLVFLVFRAVGMSGGFRGFGLGAETEQVIDSLSVKLPSFHGLV